MGIGGVFFLTFGFKDVQRVIYSAVSNAFEGRNPIPPQSHPGLAHTAYIPTGQTLQSSDIPPI
jgi:hypothetical protein